MSCGLISKFHAHECNLSRKHHLHSGIAPESVEVLSGGGTRGARAKREKSAD